MLPDTEGAATEAAADEVVADEAVADEAAAAVEGAATEAAEEVAEVAVAAAVFGLQVFGSASRDLNTCDRLSQVSFADTSAIARRRPLSSSLAWLPCRPRASLGWQACRRRCQPGVKSHAHMLRHACGFKPANNGIDTRSLQAYLGDSNIQNTAAIRRSRRGGLRTLEGLGVPINGHVKHQ